MTGSRSGEHAARVRAHPDGQGASLIFAQPFRGGETVTVQTDLDVAGATDGDFTFATLAAPGAGLGSGSPPPRALLRQFPPSAASPPKGAVPRYRTRRDLRPPEIQLSQAARAGMSPGYTFLAPKKVFARRAAARAAERPADHRPQRRAGLVRAAHATATSASSASSATAAVRS